ncbi:MAG: hypothetical protein A2X64_09370 [Ignavibacteria bacterium GWF2_33_9]|nr:MAG: hypothetical protein A2X64_09370 [Ignavibacteria bacterium GWF2_33_9]
MSDNFHKPISGTKIVFGALLILFGLGLLGLNLGIIPSCYWGIIISWQMLLIALGVIFLFGRNTKTSGIILIIVGGVFLLPEFTSYNIHFLKHIFPILIILLGLSLLLKKKKKNTIFRQANLNTSDQLDLTAIFSGGEIVYTDPIFKGGEVTAIFGGYHLDLSKSALASGITYLDITAIFGGVEIVVPANWKITSKATAIFGGVEDKRHHSAAFDSMNELVLIGTTVFGGVEIKGY